MPVKIIGFGQVESAATIVFCASKDRFSTKNCRFTIHEGTVTIGTPTLPLSVHQAQLQNAEVRRKAAVSIYAQTLKKSEEEVEALIKKGQSFDPEEARKLGLVTEIIDKLF